MLNELSDQQETIREMLEEIRQVTDRTMFDAVVQQIPESETDNVISVTQILIELSRRRKQEPRPEDLIWAMEFIDHLDTLGRRIVSK